MKMERSFICSLLAMAYVFVFFAASLAFAQPDASAPKAVVFDFRGVEYAHRWSKAGQNEFTPNGETNLSSWNDMVTLNVHEAVSTGEQLAEIANKVSANYQRSGKVLRTDSKPRTSDRPAEHLIVAVLGAPAFLEAAFARFALIDGVGIVIVYSHRVYGQPAGAAMSDWLKANGPQVESALMAWDKAPTPRTLRGLPQSN